MSKSKARSQGGLPELTAQPAAERRAAEAFVSDLVARFAPAHRTLVAAMRRWLRKRLPTAHELAYEYREWFVLSYSPNGLGHTGVLALRGDADGVKLYLNGGKGLPDPEKLLRGSGGKVRWIALERASTVARPAIAALVEGAIARNPVPFASTGRGPVVIQSKSGR